MDLLPGRNGQNDHCEGLPGRGATSDLSVGNRPWLETAILDGLTFTFNVYNYNLFDF